MPILGPSPTLFDAHQMKKYLTFLICLLSSLLADFAWGQSTTSVKRTYSGTINGFAYKAFGGLLSVEVNPNKSFTGKLRFPTRTVAINGAFDTAQTPQAVISIPANSAEFTTAATSLRLTLTEGIAISASWILPQGLVSHQRVTTFTLLPLYVTKPGTAKNPDGRYVMLLTPEKSKEDVMRGSGFGSLVIAKNYSIIMIGTLPDGTGFTSSSFVTTDEKIPALITTNLARNILLGTVNSEESFFWFRSSAGLINDPFTLNLPERQINVEISRYTPPAKGSFLLPDILDTDGNAYISFSAAGRDEEDSTTFIESALRLTRAHRFVFPTPNPYRLRLDFYVPTGFFTGSFSIQDPHATIPRQFVQRTVSFRGMLFPSDDPNVARGEGFFLVPPPPNTVNVSLTSGLVSFSAKFPDLD